MPNDLEWGCWECFYYDEEMGMCFLHDKKVKYSDLCPDWEVLDG